MDGLMTRREALLERALMDLLEFVNHSRDPYWCEYSEGKASDLRRQADRLDRQDAAVARARELTGYDPEQQRTKNK